MKYLQLLFLTLVPFLYTTGQLVVQVYDGDTYKIFDKGIFKIIRLANVDAPEPGQYYGTIAKSAASKLILGKIVQIEVYGKDRYGRIVANIIVDDNSLDSILITNGWAWHYSQYSYHTSLSIYQELAKSEKMGMWRCAYNVPPWIWRKMNKKQKRLNEMCR